MWTAYLVDLMNSGTTWTYVIVYSDGKQKQQFTYQATTISDETIKASARAEIARLSQVANSTKPTLQIGQAIDLTVTPPVVPTPDPAVVAQAKFMADLRTLSQLQRAVSFGLIAVDDPRIADAQKAVQSEWLDSYLAVL